RVRTSRAYHSASLSRGVRVPVDFQRRIGAIATARHRGQRELLKLERVPFYALQNAVTLRFPHPLPATRTDGHHWTPEGEDRHADSFDFIRQPKPL
ncbi:hypothetical protein, partial [Rhabdochromatium marinum]|uniref:hypothetical protein n=1 Tax=Rhabdochromatium marinum TaxID=48729 RepID=UPI001A923A24